MGSEASLNNNIKPPIPILQLNVLAAVKRPPAPHGEVAEHDATLQATGAVFLFKKGQLLSARPY